jgi:hypothetical protein
LKWGQQTNRQEMVIAIREKGGVKKEVGEEIDSDDRMCVE